MNKTVTITIDNVLDSKFRERVAHLYGDSKGALGKAIAEAIKKWLQDYDSSDSKAVELMHKGYHLGGGPYYKNRSELYERSR